MKKQRNCLKKSSSDKEDPKRSKNLGGRPTIYTDETAEKIYKAISTTKYGIKYLCKHNPDFPALDTVYMWIARNDKFSELYYKAKRNQMNFHAEELIAIADNVKNDHKLNKNGEWVVNNEAVNRSRLRIDTRKWLMSKLMPKIYGDKIFNPEDNSIIKHADALKELE